MTPPPQLRITAAIVALVLAIWAGVGFHLWVQYQETESEAARNAQNLVRVIEAQVHGQLDAIDVTLLAVGNALPLMAGSTAHHDPQVHALLKALLAKADAVRAIWVVNSQGDMLHDSDNRPGSFNYAHRAYFTAQRDNPKLGLYVGEPIANDKGVWFISLSRRITRPDGSFGGVVVAALEPRYFERMFTTLNVGKAGNVTLLTTDFKLIARQPAADAMRGQSVRGKTLLPTLVEQARQGVYRSNSAVDRLDRFHAYRVVQNYPLVVVVGLGYGEILAGWWRSLAVTALATATLSVLLGILGWRVQRELRTSGALNDALTLAKGSTETALIELEGVLEAIPDLMFEVDGAGRIHSYRGQRNDLLYVPESVFLVKLVSEVLPMHAAEVILEAIGAAQHHGHSVGASYHLDLPDGRHWFELSVARKGAAQGLESRFIFLVRDVSERVLAKQALETSNQRLTRSNTDLEQFAYAASHDLLEPLRSVSGSVQLLQKRYAGQLDARADTFIAHAVGGAQRMQALIADLLAFSRLSTGAEAMVPVHLDAIVATARGNLEAAIAESAAQITQDPLPAVHGDAGQLSHLFQNLIANALKFRGDKPAIVHIGARREPQQWVIWVADQGIGIAPQYFERIFGIFKRLHTREEYAGNGIGLTLCQRIVEHHGGRIWVESQPGQGTTFFFSLPDKVA